MKILKTFLIMCILITLSNATDNTNSIVLNYTSKHSMLIVTVFLDNVEKHLILDTGSEHTMIQDSRNIQHSTKINISNRTLINIPVIYIQFAGTLQGDALQATNTDGILGQDVLRHFHSILINYDKQTITLE